MQRILSSIKHFNRKYYLDYLAIFVLAIIFFSQLQGTFTLPEPDSFYHAKITEYLSQGKILHQFPWLQETGLKDAFVDQHFLFHLLSIPFVVFEDPLVGVKMAVIFFTSLAIVTIYWFLKKFNVRWPFLYILVLLLSPGWLFRLSIVKAPMVFLIFLLLAYYFLTKKRRLDLFLIAFFSVWLYGGWPMMLALPFIYLSAFKFKQIIQAESFKAKLKSIFKLRGSGLPWFGITSVSGGVLAGLIINPYFPANLKFFKTIIYDIAIVNYHEVVRVGGEWYPYGIIQFITGNPLLCSLLAVSVLLLVINYKKAPTHALVWGVFSVVALIFTLKSRRNIEYFIPFTLIFFAFSFQNYLNGLSLLRPAERIVKKWHSPLAIILLVFLFSFLFTLPNNLLSIKKSMLSGLPIDYLKEGAAWLKENTPKDSVIFNSDWDIFPPLFYYNDHNYYLTGLDHTLMYKKNQTKFLLYEKIISGEEIEDLDLKIKENFNARYVFVQQGKVKFDENLSTNNHFEKVFEDKYAKIYKIVD